MKFIKIFFVFTAIAIAGLIYISPEQASRQSDLYTESSGADPVFEQLTSLSGGRFFVLPVISHDPNATLTNLDSDYLGINVSKNLSTVLKSSKDRFQHGDHFVVPMQSGRNNFCFLADDLEIAKDFLAKPQGPWTFDERMVIHELAHCQYRFSKGEKGNLDEFLLSEFSKYVMKVAVDKSDHFRVTATTLEQEYVDLYHEIYADLFTIAYFRLIKDDKKTSEIIASYRNDALVGSRDIIHWSSPHIPPFIQYLSIADKRSYTFAELDQMVKEYIIENTAVFGPSVFLEMMVVIGKSEIENRNMLRFSDFDAKADLKGWVSWVFESSEG